VKAGRCDPRYLTSQEFTSLQGEVRKCELIAAFVGGDGGLRDIQIIPHKARDFLKKEGFLALETGIAHPRKLQNKERHFSIQWTSRRS
jgi:methylase of polypeptide subunit release factors